MILKMSRMLLILWMFVGIPLKCVAQSDDEKEAEKSITDSAAALKEINEAVAEINRVNTLVDDTNIPAAPADAAAAVPAKEAAEKAIPQAITALGKMRDLRRKGAEVLGRLARSRIAMMHWEAEAGAVTPTANTEDADKATALGARLETALTDLSAPLAVGAAGPPLVPDGVARTAEITTAPAALTSVRRKYWFARNVEDPAAVLTEMQTKADAQRDLAAGGLTTRANDVATLAGNALTAVNNARDNTARDRAAVQKALNDAVAVLAQVHNVESEALDILNDVDAIDKEIRRIKAADAAVTADVAILRATAAATATISSNGGLNDPGAPAGGGGAARSAGPIQKAIQDAMSAITEAQRVLGILDARDDIAKSIELITAAQTTADAERQRAKTEHDKTITLQTDMNDILAAAQASQKKVADAEKEKTATDEDRIALKIADEDLKKVTEQEQIVTARIGTAGTENTNAETARARVATRLTDANTANTEVLDVANFASGSAFDESEAVQRKLRARERAISAKKDIEDVTSAANAVATAIMDINSARALAKRWAEKADDQTPEGRKKADQVAERVIQEDIDARTAEANKKAMENAMKIAQAAQQVTEEQTDMTNQQQEQQTQDQSQNQLPDTNGGIVNIDHLYDEVYVQPAAGDSDVNCLNNLHRCSDPTIAAQCAGTCTRQDNGDDHADNCAGMTDLCLEDHYRDLMSTYCVGTCG